MKHNKYIKRNNVKFARLDADADKLSLLTDAFSQVQFYLQSADRKQGYARLNAPGLYSFPLPTKDDANKECMTHNEKDDMLTGRWLSVGHDSIFEANAITEAQEAQLGVLQKDEKSGEIYMLMPIEMHLLLKPAETDLAPATVPPANVTNMNSSTTLVDSNVAAEADLDIEDDDDDDDEVGSQTTLTDTPRSEEAASRHELNEYIYVVPKICLNFQLTFDVGKQSKTKKR